MHSFSDCISILWNQQTCKQMIMLDKSINTPSIQVPNGSFTYQAFIAAYKCFQVMQTNRIVLCIPNLLHAPKPTIMIAMSLPRNFSPPLRGRHQHWVSLRNDRNNKTTTMIAPSKHPMNPHLIPCSCMILLAYCI